MDDDVMLVRIGGDVVRRPVAYTHRIVDMSGVERASVQEPELRPGEIIIRTLDDPIPRIIKDYR